MRHERRHGPRRLAAWIGDALHPTVPVPTDHDAGACDEGSQIESRVIEDASTFGVSGVVQLKTAIEAETVDDIRAHAPANAIGGFEHRDLDTVGGEMSSGSESTQPCSYDNDGHGAHISHLRRHQRPGEHQPKCCALDPVGRPGLEPATNGLTREGSCCIALIPVIFTTAMLFDGNAA